MPRGFGHLKVGLCPLRKWGFAHLVGLCPVGKWGFAHLASGALPTWQVGLCPPSGALPIFVGLCPLFMQIRLKDDFSLDPVGCG